MGTDPDRLSALLKKYIEDEITEEELRELARLAHGRTDLYELERRVEELWKDAETYIPAVIPDPGLYESILDHPLLKADPPVKDIRRRRWLRSAGAAAVVFACMALGWYGRMVVEKQPEEVGQTPAVSTIVPGGNKATLTLGDGQVVNLSETQSGIVFGDELTYTDGSGVLPANGRQSGESTAISLTTPNGGTYQVILSDGTKVWLNSASKLRYPAKFSGQREVELEGEAFFEVAPKKTPFLVKTRDQVVEVLGTQFNITGYPDESEVRTTLLEGAVQVINAHSNAISRLSPGKQSVVKGRQTEVRKVDTEPYVAWKNGYFAFPDEHISRVMNTIARWYNIEVEYQGDMTNKYFGGTLSRFENFETLLRTIELTGSVRFKIEGRRVIVMT